MSSSLFSIGGKIVSTNEKQFTTGFTSNPSLYVKPPKEDEVVSNTGQLYTFTPSDKFFTVIRSTKKWVLGKDGYLYEVPPNEPALEYYTNGDYRGVLVEPESKNDCLQSEDFGTTWANDRIVLTDWLNQLTAPDGTTTADKLIQESGETTAGFVRQGTTVSAGTHTFSVFAKKGTRNWIFLRTDAASSTAGVWFNINTGEVGTEETGLTGNIIEYPNDWYRCSITFTAIAGSANFWIYNADTDNTLTVADDGGYQYIWGAQLELSPIATSYIPTTTDAVTRVKDDISLTNVSSLIGQTEGTLFVEVDWQLVSGAFQHLLNVSDGSTSRMRLYKNSSDELVMFAQAGGSPLVDQGESATAYTGIQKIAFVYKTDDFELYRNGSSISSLTNGSLASLATMDEINFAQSETKGGQANMHIKSIGLFKTRLSDAECVKLTAGYTTFDEMAEELRYTLL